MKKIKLSQGKFALIDDEDYKIVNCYKWFTDKRKRVSYAMSHYRKEDGSIAMIRMHRLIMKPGYGLEVDHIDKNGLNNQKHNLRIVDHYTNMLNSKHPHDENKFKGINFIEEQKNGKHRLDFAESAYI